MVGRRQPPVHSPVRPVALASAIGSALRSDAPAHADLAATLNRRFDAEAVALTDSGTSALVLELRLTVGDGGTVAIPA
jgi:dTDP-4-amino-4,6-dideoxygalactose transaminase